MKYNGPINTNKWLFWHAEQLRKNYWRHHFMLQVLGTSSSTCRLHFFSSPSHFLATHRRFCRFTFLYRMMLAKRSSHLHSTTCYVKLMFTFYVKLMFTQVERSRLHFWSFQAVPIKKSFKWSLATEIFAMAINYSDLCSNPKLQRSLLWP